MKLIKMPDPIANDHVIYDYIDSYDTYEPSDAIARFTFAFLLAMCIGVWGVAFYIMVNI